MLVVCLWWTARPLVCLPAALAATAVILGAGPRGLRWICLIWAACGVVFFLLRAVASFPFIEIADGLGGGAMERVGDWMSLCLACVAAVFAVVIGHFVRKVPVRLGTDLGLLAFIVTRQFQSPDTPYAARPGPVTLAGVLLAADGLPVLATRRPSWLPLGRCGWVLVVPGLLLLADWQGRVWWGRCHRRFARFLRQMSPS